MSKTTTRVCDVCPKERSGTEWDTKEGWASLSFAIYREPFLHEEMDICPDCWANSNNQALVAVFERVHSENALATQKRLEEHERQEQRAFEMRAQKAGIPLGTRTII